MISAREFSKRRKEIIGKMNPNSCMILFSGCELKASEDAVHDFWVNRNFYYLTGVTQANSVLVLVKFTNARSRSILLIDEINENKIECNSETKEKINGIYRFVHELYEKA